MSKKNVVYLLIALILIIGTVCYILFDSKHDNGGNDSDNTFVSLKIVNGDEIISDQYKVGDTFQCNLLGEEFEIKIDRISDEKVKLSSSKYGLCPSNEDGTINLNAKVKKFELSKGKELDLRLQATDAGEGIIIIWE